jgi:hypothetical protein
MVWVSFLRNAAVYLKLSEAEDAFADAQAGYMVLLGPNDFDAVRGLDRVLCLMEF